MAEQVKLFQPLEYYSSFIDSAVRPDGRELSTFGPTSISVGFLKTAYGSALVNLRDTTVTCGIKAELANPDPEKPGKGFVVPNVDFPPICSNRFKPGPPPEEAQICSQLIANLLESSSFIRLEDLCIQEGKLCWCLYVDITCLKYSGNLLDACVLAMVCAAKNTALPEISLDNEAIHKTSNLNPLIVGDLPISSTFAVFKNNLISDPTSDEEHCASGTISVIMSEKGMIYDIYMHKGCSVTESCLNQCIQLSRGHCRKVVALINDLAQHCNN